VKRKNSCTKGTDTDEGGLWEGETVRLATERCVLLGLPAPRSLGVCVCVCVAASVQPCAKRGESYEEDFFFHQWEQFPEAMRSRLRSLRNGPSLRPTRAANEMPIESDTLVMDMEYSRTTPVVSVESA